jgi:hypothetical protein
MVSVSFVEVLRQKNQADLHRYSEILMTMMMLFVAYSYLRVVRCNNFEDSLFGQLKNRKEQVANKDKK